MNGKTFSIPFRLPSLAGEAFCKDGELSDFSGFDIIPVSGVAIPNGDESSDSNSPVTKDFVLELPPVPEIEFALTKDLLPGWHSHPDMFPSVIIEGSEPFEQKSAEALSLFLEETDKCSLFTSPFLVIGVWRLKSGCRVMATSPQLMIPATEPPAMVANSSESSSQTEFSVLSSACRLNYKMKIQPDVNSWKAEIEGLEIMISKPLALFESTKTCRLKRNYSSASYCVVLDERSGKMTGKRISGDTFEKAYLPATNGLKSLSTRLLECDSFYGASFIPLSELRRTEGFIPVIFEAGTTIDSILTGEGYKPDYMCRSVVNAAGMSLISGRRTLWDITLTPPASSGLPYSQISSDGEFALPRWIFHPDPDCREFYSENEGVSYPMKRHPTLYGSYYFGGLEMVRTSFPTASSGPAASAPKRYPSGIWRSGKSELLLYPDNLFFQLDATRIIALCRAYRSSGLIATVAPTVYAFTDEGVFLLREQANGSFTDAGLISSVILGDSDSISMNGKILSFKDTEGNMMKIEGTTVKDVTPESSSCNIVIKGRGGEGHLVTRMIKLSGADKWKRLFRVSLIGNFNPECLSIRVFGSRNLRERFLIGKGKSSATMLSARFRYFNLEIEGVLGMGESLEGLLLTVF